MRILPPQLRKWTVARFGRYVPFRAVKPFLARRLTSVFYHRVSDEISPFVKYLYRHKNIEGFRRDLDFFGRHFHFVSFDEVVDHFRNGRSLPKYPLFLSFDDGHRELYDIVGPILKAKGIPATFFLTTGLIDNKLIIFPHKKSFCADVIERMPADELERIISSADSLFPDSQITLGREFLRELLSLNPNIHKSEIDRLGEILDLDWAEILSKYKPYVTSAHIKSLLKDGFTVGAHTHSHIKLRYLPEKEAEAEVKRSVDFLADHFGLDSFGFSFPNSDAGLARSWLDDLMKKNEKISMLFSTGKFKRNGAMLVNRLSMEEPWRGGEGFAALEPEQKITAVFLSTTGSQ